ncbi:TIGR03085 family metal-binding protein [uncultured Propionibacterium sp.]|uniref:TIGR03085 family metal-binding protein n=1 Tax=uncultured Propionibacterium sp. TaxID=218066 RepID=UPI00292CAC01|nr:TIGR03085 family metal-binding protein [uncultured Propionibacterium sp.]
MTLVLAGFYRSTICDLFEQVGPGAPTLCEGWTAQDLAAHLFLRENDPLSTPGMFSEIFAPITAARMRTLLARQGFDQIVSTLRGGPIGLSVMRLRAVDKRVNGIEYLIHYEDLLRAQPAGSFERPALSAEGRFALSDQTWGAIVGIGKMIGRRSEVGLKLARDDGAAEIRMLAKGSPEVVVRGTPAELAMWLYGRDADVELIGEAGPLALVDEAVARGI